MSIRQEETLPDKVPFAKLSASANDFIVLDNREGAFTKQASYLARALCSRRYSVGADGLILIEKSAVATCRIHFLNPDGNEFNTCGNGGRCAARFARQLLLTGNHLTLQTNIGIIRAEVCGQNVKLGFIRPSQIELNRMVEVDGHRFTGHYVQVGEPHFVTIQTDIRKIEFVDIARKLRYCAAFAPEGANVHFVEPMDRQRLKIRTYERGVENETLACGSGCVSAATSTFKAGITDSPVTFEPQSRIPLTVHFNGPAFDDLYLEGDARLVYQGEATREAMSGFPIAGEP